MSELRRLTEVPSCWTVPVEGRDAAYHLDLSGDDPEHWTKDDGEHMSMAAIIKHEVRHDFDSSMYYPLHILYDRIKMHGAREAAAR